VYAVEEAEGLCGKNILKFWQNVENFLQKKLEIWGKSG
jgi:hypothetical protein